MPKKPLKRICDELNLKGRYVVLRTPMNVPLVNGVIQNQFRITRGLATMNYLVKHEARVILVGHIGDGEPSTEPIAKLLANHLPSVLFSPEVTGSVSRVMRDALKDGEVLVLENVRRDPREKKNDSDFARSLADLGDLYVNDAFADSHREHASICAITQFLPSYIGMNFRHECEELTKARTPKSPSLFMLGGAKFDTKMPLVEQFLEVYDHVFIGGALAHDFFRAKGLEIGKSLVSEVDLTNSPLLYNPKLLLPVDVTVFDGEKSYVSLPDMVQSHEQIFDMGPATLAMLAPFIQNAASILWNGPFGNYEAGYEEFTSETARLIAAATGYSVIGGGDTVAAIETIGSQEKFGFLSTAGGAMLTFLETGTLVGIEAILASKS
ncbi:MAG: phosphoglycerate kinase [Parcubacteria group bacterium CG2_30_44_11]|nr:MAG: phosphoglycerate kinase [Parcubacteria group bacterium CG2_30_44_11]